ncbi:MAG: A24 family peptidase [Actinomycetota bacterium]|nr:A24 family peptidase [Actinomycetota bacterium]
MTGSQLLAVAVAMLFGALGGALAPRVVAALPEPAPEEGAVEADPGVTAAHVTEQKIAYSQLAARPHLALRSALAAAVVCGLVAAQLDATAGLPMWIYLGVVGVILTYVDWRTRLLPTRLIAPSYAVVGVLALLASALSGDWTSLVRAVAGWAIAGGLFFLLWFIYPKGMGYGDVRLSGILGTALGWLGWAELVVGVYAGFVLGAVGGGVLALLRVVDRKRYPFGPFMLLGALVGVLVGPTFGAWYAG